MSTIELEAQKASLAREILTIDDEKVLNNIWLLLKGDHSVTFQQNIPGKRKLGILNGIAKIEFSNDFEMTTEELLSMR